MENKDRDPFFEGMQKKPCSVGGGCKQSLFFQANGTVTGRVSGSATVAPGIRPN